MTLKYKLFGKPGNLEEFLDKQEYSGKKKIKIGLFNRSEYDQLGFSIVDYRLVIGNSEKDVIILKKDSGLSGLFKMGNSNNIESNLYQGTKRLIKKIEKRGFDVKQLDIKYREKKIIPLLLSAAWGLGGAFGIGYFTNSHHNQELANLIIAPSVAGFLLSLPMCAHFLDSSLEKWKSISLKKLY